MPPNTVDIQTYIRGILSNFKFYKEAVVLDYIDNPFFVRQEQLDSYGTGFTLEMIQRCPRGTRQDFEFQCQMPGLSWF